MQKKLLENPQVLRWGGIGNALFGVALSFYYYSNFPNISTFIPACMGIGIALYTWNEAKRYETQ